MAKILIPTPLRKYANNESTFQTKGKTVKEAIQDLTTTHESLKQYLFDDQEQLRSYIRVYLGEEDINTLQKEETPVQETDTVSIIPAIAGG